LKNDVNRHIGDFALSLLNLTWFSKKSETNQLIDVRPVDCELFNLSGKVFEISRPFVVEKGGRQSDEFHRVDRLGHPGERQKLEKGGFDQTSSAEAKKIATVGFLMGRNVWAF